MSGIAALVRKGNLWTRVVAGPSRFAAVSGSLVSLLGLAALGRLGTDTGRSVAFGLAGSALCVGAWAVMSAWRTRRRPERLVRSAILPWNAPLGRKVMRAVQLVGSTQGEDAMSVQLAELHLDRTLARVSEADLIRHAARRARVYQWIGGGLALVFLVVNLLKSRQLAEGFNLLAASGERAPLTMYWIERLVISARAPAYLHLPERRVLSGGRSRLPVGTELTLRALPLHQDRRLVITDGEREVELVSDGSGGLVAHYTVLKDVELRVAAKFGERLIVEEHSTQLVVVKDREPQVFLEGAPRTQSLADVSRLPLRWQIADDHGLRQIELVLKSGSRSERRTLAQLDGETRTHHGGYVLQADDEFLDSLFLPAEVTVEARDNDALSGTKWGASEPIVIVPTAVGEPEALRYAALSTGRDRFVAALAVGEQESATLKFSAALREAELDLLKGLAVSYGGLKVPSGLQSFVVGRLRSVVEAPTATAADTQALVRKLQELVLSIDSALSQMAQRDARGVAKLLGEVAEELHLGLLGVNQLEDPTAGEDRVATALYALDSGAQQLVQLGRVGHDIGSVALGDLGRIVHSTDRRDWFHAALAAHHLAERLKRGTSSFGAKGGGSSGSGGGVEAGTPGGEPQPSNPGDGASGDGPPSPTDPFDELARQIAELARQHAVSIEEVGRAVRGGESSGASENLRAEAKRRAVELREEVELLPLPGHLPGTVRAIASLAREHSRAMSHGLEGLELEAAFRSGTRARAAFNKSLSDTQQGGRLSRRLLRGQTTLENTLSWVEARLRESRTRNRQVARSQLAGSASMEMELAKISEGLSKQGQKAESSLPREVIERLEKAGTHMQRAAAALRRGEGESGLSEQRTAQRLLEQADRGQTSDSTPKGGDDADGVDGPNPDDPQADSVPEGEANDRAAAFRRRVLENLGDSETGRLSPAIQRYAEGLLN